MADGHTEIANRPTGVILQGEDARRFLNVLAHGGQLKQAVAGVSIALRGYRSIQMKARNGWLNPTGHVTPMQAREWVRDRIALVRRTEAKTGLTVRDLRGMA